MSELLKLAERCEAATGSCGALDTEIALAIGAKRSGNLWWIGPKLLGRTAPYFTTSLDAAMSLVPEGYDWIIGRTNSGLTIHAEVGGRGDEFQRFGATPALALCAAALRARATLTQADAQ